MKIFATVRNYGGSDAESPFGAGDPAWYEIPDSSLLRSGQPFFVPDFAREFRAFPTVVYRLSRLGKGIGARFVPRYIDAVTMGCCVVAVDLLQDLRRAGDPWCRAVAFDKCCMLGRFLPCDGFPSAWSVKCGGQELVYDLRQAGHDVTEMLERLSRDITVKEGDLIMTALHPEGLALRVGTKLTVDREAGDEEFNKILDVNIR